MEVTQLTDLLNNTEPKTLEKFVEKKEAEYSLSKDSHSIQFDYTWLDKIEETIQYLDNIIRDPKRFLAQEEEVVPVEKAKKISMETIKHLAQHTNLIQDVDEDGRITPSAVLNIHKEETFDLYENRFINSLLSNLYIFIQQRKKAVAEGSFSKCQRNLSFKAETKIDSEKINIDLTMKTDSFEENKGTNADGLDCSQRIEKIEFVILDFMKTPLIKSLNNAPPVRSPIRKTNAILKNTNFKKALELWEYIERYDFNDRKENKENFVITSDKEIENNLLLTFFANYAILANTNQNKNSKEIKDSNYYLRKIIQDFISDNKDINSSDFRDILSKTFSTYRKKKLTEKKKIYLEFDRCIKKYNNNLKEATKILKNM